MMQSKKKLIPTKDNYELHHNYLLDEKTHIESISQ